jgi:formimidoylglutamate deiminase
MARLRIKKLLSRRGWLRDQVVAWDEQGLVTSIAPYDSVALREEIAIGELDGFLLPGIPNCHSHSFQYAMVGATEWRSGKNGSADNFWSWRQEMYRLAASLTPEDFYSISRRLYQRMIRQGFTSVAEFHYVHHQADGTPYENPAEISSKIIAAALDAGISLTLVPVYYSQGDFETPPKEEQSRFVFKDLDSYRTMIARLKSDFAKNQSLILGQGVHSLRAVRGNECIALASDKLSGPFHLHIAEQEREVTSCRAAWGERPVSWLFKSVEIDERFSLVHATHVNGKELTQIAESGANVVLCPSTEANLGDGIFPLTDFYQAGGRFCIGTDSHVGLAPFEEMRWLDYVQRLVQKKRNPLCRPGERSGEVIFENVWLTGMASLGRKRREYFEVGEPFDGIFIACSNETLIDRSEEEALSTIVFGGDALLIDAVYCRGQERFSKGHSC